MAKKKNKKPQKQVDWTSPPPSPKPAPEEPVPAVPAPLPPSPRPAAGDPVPGVPVSLPLSPETAPTESTQDDPAQSVSSLPEAKIDSPIAEEPSVKLTPEETVVDVPSKQETSSETGKEERLPPAPEFTEEVEASTKQGPKKPAPEKVPEKPPETTDERVKERSLNSIDPVPSAPKPPQETEGESLNEPISSGTAEVPPPPVEKDRERSPTKPTLEVEPEVTNPTDNTTTQPEKFAEEVPENKIGPSPALEPKAGPEKKQEAPDSKEPETLERSEAKINHIKASSPTISSTKTPPTPSAAPEPTPNPSPAFDTEQPRSQAVNQVVEESRPPAPTPPITRARPRHTSAFDDDDEDDSALIQPRLRGEALSRDSSRGSTYPPPTHSRALFASRVPVEQYSNPPPPPPQYHHPRYYPPAAPPYYHAPSMSQSGGYPNQNPYGPPSHGSSPYQESWGHVPPSYGPYGSQSPPQRHDSMGSREYPMGPPGVESGSAIEDDSGDVFSRIAQAIPDLHVLLARYKETHGQLGVREELLRRSSVEQQEKLRIKDVEIMTLKDRIANMENKQSTEASRLRLEIGNMEEQVKDLKEKLSENVNSKEEVETLKEALGAAMNAWEAKYKDLEEAHAMLQNSSAEELAKAQLDFEEWKSTATTKHDAEKIALAIQFDKKLKEADVAAENLRQVAATAFVKEKDDLRSEHQRQQREREANFDVMRKELETKLGAAQLDCEQALKRERESMEVWSKERGTLVQAHREDIESLRKSWDEQRSLLEGQHKKIKDESDKAWIELHADANRKAEEYKALVDQLTKDKEEIQKQYNELKADNEREKEVIKSVAGNLETEKARLEKLMECYGDIAEIKSKGDTYYLVSFSQLQKQILDLAATHFVHLPVSPPPEDLAQVPSTLPSFLGDTSSARQIRAVYVAHTVSKLVTYRVFGPFLFSLGRRYDKADSLFSSMSNHIRDKSSRKEAIWRQQTLLAAFTSSGAKQRINTAAGTVVEEIVNAIKNFADPREEEGIKIAVKRIIKLAAETWRFARLERELITATMPSPQDEEHQYTSPEYWPAYRPEGTPIASLAGTAPPSDERPQRLLRLFPVIYREPKHESLRNPEDEKVDEGCVYHHGLALYDDAEPVVQRAEELKAAGLPPLTTASPTAADFPPPLVPSPRNPLPPTPSVKGSVRSKSPSSGVGEKIETMSVRSKSPLSEVHDKASVRSKSPSIASEKASIRSKPDPPVSSDKASIRSNSPPPPPSEVTENVVIDIRSPAPDEVEKGSIRSPTPPQPPPPPPSSPPLPPPEAFLDPPSPPPAPPSVHSESRYTRPPPGPIDFSTPRDIPGSPTQPENVNPPPSEPIPPPPSAPPPPPPSDVPPLPAPTGSIAPSLPPSSPPPPPPPPLLEPIEVPPPPPEVPIEAPQPPPAEPVGAPPGPPLPALETLERHPPLPAPTESAIIPPYLPPSSSASQGLPTPPRSPAPTPPQLARPISPLFAALDEIEALSSHRSRNPSSSRRSARTRTPDEEPQNKDRPDTSRRTSGYAISNRSSAQTSEKSDWTGRTSGSRYMCESRSAAIKALYPNSPLAGTSGNGSGSLSRTNSLRRKERRGSGVGEAGTWDTDSKVTSVEGNQEPSTHS